MGSNRERTILIVEDSDADRYIIRRMLLKDGPEHRVLEAATGAEGLALCRTARPDCVMLDFFLPDMTATDFLAELSPREQAAVGLPVVVLSGKEDHELAVASLNAGAQDYLIKGTVTGHGLVRVVENAIEKFHIRRELEEKRVALELRKWELEMVRDELQGRLAELAFATRAKDQFIAVMSHEMRTPLNAILGYADLMDMGVGGDLPEPHRRHLERIRVGGRHLLDLINDVLDLARADARRLDLDLRPVDLLAVLEEVAALLESQAEIKGIALVLDPCETPIPPVQADLQRLRQVLTNIVGNAIKFTDEGEVRIACGAPPGGPVRVRVSDTGIGISADVLPLIFDEFFQGDSNYTREHGGSGLGLAVAQRLARLMGGDVTAESELGKGSTFTLRLAASPAGSELRPEDVAEHEARMGLRAAVAPGAPPPHADGAGGPITVVAYGHSDEVLAELARRTTPRVRLAWTTRAEEVPALAERERPSLVVLDISGADDSAWRAAHALQSLAELSRTAVLLLPGIPAPEGDEVPGGLDLGWVALVPKPFTAEQLGHAVSQAVRGAGGAAAGEPAGYEVLVVDDDEDSRRVAAHFLDAAHIRVREAPDGETALITMRRRPPDVVVLDLMMPVLDGFGVLAAMRADPLLVAIPVVVLSAKTLSDAERQFLARTTVRVLQKGEHRLADVAALVLRAARSATLPASPADAPPAAGAPRAADGAGAGRGGERAV